eukprot:8229414-Ditylum_brightwellii.AAC.1
MEAALPGADMETPGGDTDPLPVKPELESFDWEAYASNYSGRGKLLRMIFVADRLSSPVAADVLKAAAAEAKEGEDAALYKQVVGPAGAALPPRPPSKPGDSAVADTLSRSTDIREAR